MGAQLLLLPLLFVIICVSFLILQNFYQRWRMKELMKKKREAAKISLVNIMQLTNSTLISPTWPREQLSATEPGNKNDLPTYNQLIANERACAGGDILYMRHMDAQNSHILSSVVTLREDPESPPPYEDLYDSKGKPQFQPVLFRYQSPCRALALASCPSSEPECNSPKRICEGCGVGCSEAGDSNIYPQNKTCLLQIPQQPTQPESDPSQERRNSSAVLYL